MNDAPAPTSGQQSAAAYNHTQHAPLALLLYLAGAGMAIVGWSIGSSEALAAFGSIGIVLALVGLAFQHLTVRDEGDRLALRFGPLPLFRKTIRYDDINHVERGRTLIVEGWGIHCSPRGGWVWNLWGRDCIVVRLHNGSTLRIGTDDPDGLLEFLAARILHSAAQP